MKTIYKYELQPMDTQYVEMPKGAKILSAQVQRNKLCLWAYVDSGAKTEGRVIAIVGTGNPLPRGIFPEEGTFIDTVQFDGGSLVFHVFDMTWKGR